MKWCSVALLLSCTSAAPIKVEIVSLAPVTLSAGDAADLLWKANADGRFEIIASTGAAFSVLQHGQMRAGVTNTLHLLPSRPLDGSNSITVIPLAPHSASVSAALTVSGGGRQGLWQLSGTVSGLACGASVIVDDGFSDPTTVSASGSFSFAKTLAEGAAYSVTLTAPPGQSCTIGNGAGTIHANTTNVTVTCVASGPRLFFSDLDSGPATGGVNGNGVFVSLYGEGFGAVQGDSKVLLGGVEVATYVSWGQGNAPARQLDRIVVQVGSAVPAGAQLLQVAVGGQTSNGLPFVVRPGRILFIDPATGAGPNTGTQTDPFNSLPEAKNSSKPAIPTYFAPATTIRSTRMRCEQCAAFVDGGLEPNATPSRS